MYHALSLNGVKVMIDEGEILQAYAFPFGPLAVKSQAACS